MATKYNVLYNHILVCKEYTEDIHWKDIIHSCACNKFPKGIKYEVSKNTIHVKYEVNNKPIFESVVLPLEDDRERYNKLMYIFRDLLNLRSDDDILESKNNLENIRKKNEINLDCEWKKLKPKSVKNYLLMDFSINHVQELKLDQKKASSLYKLIQLSFQFKQLTSDHVKYSEGKVQYIKGLEYDEDSGKFYITNNFASLNKPIDSSSKSKSDISIEKCIDKWVSDYLNYCTLHL